MTRAWNLEELSQYSDWNTLGCIGGNNIVCSFQSEHRSIRERKHVSGAAAKKTGLKRLKPMRLKVNQFVIWSVTLGHIMTNNSR